MERPGAEESVRGEGAGEQHTTKFLWLGHLDFQRGGRAGDGGHDDGCGGC